MNTPGLWKHPRHRRGQRFVWLLEIKIFIRLDSKIVWIVGDFVNPLLQAQHPLLTVSPKFAVIKITS